MKEREIRTAKKFGILDKCQELEQELLQIGRIKKIEFDLNGFYSDIYQVIILARYDIPITLENYFETRKEVVKNIIKVAGNYGLTRTEDSIEDYGTTFYFVFRCSKEWKIKKTKKKEGTQNGNFKDDKNKHGSDSDSGKGRT